MQLWDDHNKQWLDVMTIYFDDNGVIRRIDACEIYEEPTKDNWHNFEGAELNKVGLVGYIVHNPNLLPERKNDKPINGTKSN